MHRLLLPLFLSCSANNPLATMRMPLDHERFCEGRVAEVHSTGSYRYLRLDADDHWFVVMSSDVAAAQVVSLHVFGIAETFHSARLDRDFSPLSFATLTQEPNP
jgi:hypothetical protein